MLESVPILEWYSQQMLVTLMFILHRLASFTAVRNTLTNICYVIRALATVPKQCKRLESSRI